MCFYNQIVWTCGFWKWSAFQYQCHKEYRIGETCGLKLVCDVDYKDRPCKICQDLAKKQRRAAKMQVDIARWLYEGNRPATVHVTEGELSKVRKEIMSLTKIHDRTRSRTLPPIRDLQSPVGAPWFELAFGNTVRSRPGEPTGRIRLCIRPNPCGGSRERQRLDKVTLRKEAEQAPEPRGGCHNRCLHPGQPGEPDELPPATLQDACHRQGGTNGWYC